jgi:hypothetical protein
VLEHQAAPHVDRILEKRVPEDRAHTIEISYAARSWSRERRVVLVIEERPDALMPHWFFLLTHATPEEIPGAELLIEYRKRGPPRRITAAGRGPWRWRSPPPTAPKSPTAASRPGAGARRWTASPPTRRVS